MLFQQVIQVCNWPFVHLLTDWWKAREPKKQKLEHCPGRQKGTLYEAVRDKVLQS